MQLREILIKVLDIIGEDIDLDIDSPKRTRLISCSNMIYHELTTEYIDLKNKEDLIMDNKKLYFTAFSKKVKDVINVIKNGLYVNFKIYPTHLEADTVGSVEVVYTYHPPEISIDDTLQLPPQYTSYTLANGIASEYFYRNGLFDEAIFYKNRYDTALLNLSRQKRNIRLKVAGRFM